MGTKALITPEQYLATHYEREPEYVRGELREKPMPDAIHAWIQRVLVLLFTPAELGLIALPKLRCQIANDVYRLPDIAVVPAHERLERVPTRPPLAIIEIVSQDERYVELIEKLRDYETWGVPQIWVVDPWTRRLAIWKSGALISTHVLSLPERNFEVRLDQLIRDMPIEE